MFRLFRQFRLKGVTRFTDQDKQELVKFQGFDWSVVFRPIFLGLVGIYIFAVGAGVIFSFNPEPAQYKTAVTRAAASPNPGVRKFLEKHQEYREWIETKGTGGELRAFNSVSTTLLKNAARASSDSSLYVNIHYSVLRIFFLIIVSSRLCVLALVGAFLLGKQDWVVHEGDDILGETGNGRLFYSGILAKLKNLTPEGIPDAQVSGLACPPMQKEEVVRASRIGKLLEEYGADSQTNIDLAGVVLSLEDYPAFVAEPGEEGLLASSFEGASLIEVTYVFLETAFEARKNFSHGPSKGLSTSPSSEKLSLASYQQILRSAFNQTLSASLKESLEALDPHSLATTVLALQAGKVLAYEREAEHWFVKSIFPQLSARSVLHSMTAFSEEYSYAERTNIRRALIYAARSSLFGPVRFAKDLTNTSRALRQWVELMLCPPHRLEAVIAEVELAHLIWELHYNWNQTFFGELESLEESHPNQIHATDTNLVLLPLAGVVSVAKKAIPREGLDRLKLLTAEVSKAQLAPRSSKAAGELAEHINTEIPEYERVLPPFKPKDIKALAADHGVEASDLKEWSAFRVVLMNFGWLARRIGDYTVPDSAVVHAVIKGAKSEAESNHLGLVGQSGVVALRAVRLQEYFGQDWQSHFYEASSANMSESKEQFERQLQGIPDDLPEDPVSSFDGAP